MSIDPQDLVDLGILDQDELGSVGGSGDAYRTAVTVVDTTASTKRVEVSGFDVTGLAVGSREDRVEVGDKVVLTGTTAADGTYTIATVVDATHFDVVEAINDSTGGTADFRHPPGASKIGVDTTGLVNTAASDVQQAIEDLDGAISGGGTDDKRVKVSSNDTTPGFLEEKIAAGPGIDLEVLNEAANEQVQVKTGYRRHFLLMGG
jgi:hypothetical protein